MKNLLVTLLITVISLGASAQGKHNKPAVLYSLPKTVLVVKVNVEEVVQKTGPYYRYAERFLGIKEVVTENTTTYEIAEIKVHRKGIADESRTFQLSQNGFVQLNKKGVICGINTTNKESFKKDKKAKKNACNNDFIANTMLTEDQLMANSTAKMAENAAKQIYRIRESRINLISGETEQMPADGNSLKTMLKKLDQAEKALITLFTGTKDKKIIKKEYEIIPEKNITNYILFRISALKGIVDKDDLSGSPVYLNASYIKNNTPPVKVKSKKGCFYNLPGIASIKVFNEEKEFFYKELEISQHGSIQSIPSKVMKNRDIKIKYNNKTGALISIEK